MYHERKQLIRTEQLITLDDVLLVTFLNVSFIDDLKPFLVGTLLCDPVDSPCSSGKSSTSSMMSSSSGVTSFRSRLSMLFTFINCLS